jgi:hypothetical protein
MKQREVEERHAYDDRLARTPLFLQECGRAPSARFAGGIQFAPIVHVKPREDGQRRGDDDGAFQSERYAPDQYR